MTPTRIITLLNLGLMARGVLSNSCKSVAPVDPAEFDVDEWTRATWYVQEQQINGYQPAEDLFCVSATYNLENKRVPFFAGTTISVYNVATESDFEENGAEGTVLCGRVRDEDKGSTLSVAPCFLPNIFSGPYWPVYIETNGTEYTVAVVSGGQIEVESGTDEDGNQLCTTKEEGVNGAGLWIFSRVPEDSTETMDRVKQEMNKLGIATSSLVNVVQGSDCEDSYSRRFIKPRDCDEEGKCNPADPDEYGNCAAIGNGGLYNPLYIIGNLVGCAFDLTAGSLIGILFGP